MRFTTLFIVSAFIMSAMARPLWPERRDTQVSNVKCGDKADALDSHTVNVALLQICGGIAGSIQKCQGNPTSTTGTSGNAEFSITPVNDGDTINVSKGRWEQGIKAVAAQCGTGVPFTATFDKGASTGDINVELKQV